MKTQHTPGPWILSGYNSSGYAIHPQEGNRIATVLTSEADAALIAAAPDMLDFVKQFDVAFSLNNPEINKLRDTNLFSTLIRQAQAAIKKAEVKP